MEYKYSYKRLVLKDGFTLTEMLVSISLIVIITVLFIANYRAAGRRTDLVMTSQKLVADFHQAQNNTLGLVKYGLIVPPGGWGIHFDLAQPDRYVIFADLNSPGETGYREYNSGESNQSYGARTILLPTGLGLSLLTRDTANVQMANVTFLPPDPQTNIYDGTATGTTLQVQIKDTRTGDYKTVLINFLGLAEVIL